VHRTWLSPRRRLGKAPIDTPRRAMGDLLGMPSASARSHDVIAAGEGIETILSLRMALPGLPMAAALSAAHLAAILFPATLRRLYIARDDDPAGDGARDSLVERAVDGRHRGDSCCRRRLGTSTKISAPSASARCGQRSASSSPRRTSPVSRLGGIAGRGKRGAAAAVTGFARGCIPLRRRGPRPGLREGDRPSSGPDRQWLRPAIFRRAPRREDH
jgi:hypothetical protein